MLYMFDYWKSIYSDIPSEILNLKNLIIPKNELEFPVIFVSDKTYIIYHITNDRTYWDTLKGIELLFNNWMLLHLNTVNKSFLVRKELDCEWNLGSIPRLKYIQTFYNNSIRWIKSLKDTISPGSHINVKLCSDRYNSVGHKEYIERINDLQVDSIVELAHQGRMTSSSDTCARFILCSPKKDLNIAIPVSFAVKYSKDRRTTVSSLKDEVIEVNYPLYHHILEI